ncbi:RagB/SusD family nutrient uptake outer membrane protein [Carboxylicivirga sp. M1479]|uniref:RagB/SusD family nutrient uptake outer membrane protein n=1 Tax=Carboxylicivirga sp. M1479 TaxID=2594476 RepID=UPI0011776B34|nr:RagB/SusD family nutrient uptake outer membrane protein [Carboxylicivirga sp. M1479]TRX71130.1 RagB/SusD family nutrient uptake outer membrane protein [Carboxylicivirga sp. M1479]
MKLYKFLIAVFLVASFIGCEDNLDTFPTDQASGPELFSDVDKAMSTINGLYRAMYQTGWGGGWEHEQFGHVALMHCGGLMAEDMVQNEQGSGWFYYDYKYQVKSDYTHTSGRPYSTWNFYYTLITNANSILASKETLSGAPTKVNSLMGQAFALRAFCYFNLARFYQQTYVGNESLPGVPIYTEPTTIDTEGKGRGTLAEVYDQVNADIDSAIVRLNPDKAAEKVHISNIDYYTANGIKAQIMIEQQRWQDAYDAAKEALTGNTVMISEADIKGGYAFNDISNKSVLWGFEVIDDQVPGAGRAGLFGHMDASASDYYAFKSRVCVSNWLYEQVDDNDIRKDWWNGAIPSEDEQPTGTQLSYNQFKFQFKNQSTGAGDYVFMRHEEMMLIMAEAACMLTNYGEARQLLADLMDERIAGYDISSLSDANTLTTNDDNGPTTPSVGSVTLLDEVFLQKRIELWGEHPRIYDIKRTKTGFTRDFTGSNHSNLISGIGTLDPMCPDWVMSIPQAEFDGNEAMDQDMDQNPW